jgi:hypothetical protein
MKILFSLFLGDIGTSKHKINAHWIFSTNFHSLEYCYLEVNCMEPIWTLNYVKGIWHCMPRCKHWREFCSIWNLNKFRFKRIINTIIPKFPTLVFVTKCFSIIETPTRFSPSPSSVSISISHHNHTFIESSPIQGFILNKQTCN